MSNIYEFLFVSIRFDRSSIVAINECNRNNDMQLNIDSLDSRF